MEMAYNMGCTLHEYLERMPSDEVPLWSALFELQAKEQKDAEEKAKRERG